MNCGRYSKVAKKTADISRTVTQAAANLGLPITSRGTRALSPTRRSTTANATSRAPQADRERTYIRRLIAQGDTKQQIKDRLVAQNGPSVLALPKGNGFDLAAYLVPIGAVAVALLLLMLLVPRWRRRAREPAPAAGAVISAADRRRVDEDLARFDR